MKNNIKQAVAKAGGQSALAKVMGVNPRTVRRWVAGEYDPHGLYLAALNRFLKTK